MVITMDTSVIFSGLYSSLGASHAILRLVLEERLQIALTVSVYFEYQSVLTDPDNLQKFGLTRSEVEDVLDVLAKLAQKHKVYYMLRPNLKDRNDDMLVECAFCSNSEFLVSSNVKDFRLGELKSHPFRVVTPSEFMKIWRSANGSN